VLLVVLPQSTTEFCTHRLNFSRRNLQSSLGATDSVVLSLAWRSSGRFSLRHTIANGGSVNTPSNRFELFCHVVIASGRLNWSISGIDRLQLFHFKRRHVVVSRRSSSSISVGEAKIFRCRRSLGAGPQHQERPSSTIGCEELSSARP
jgi:hypothetical protein